MADLLSKNVQFDPGDGPRGGQSKDAREQALAVDHHLGSFQHLFR
jgi:hypothetical protein